MGWVSNNRKQSCFPLDSFIFFPLPYKLGIQIGRKFAHLELQFMLDTVDPLPLLIFRLILPQLFFDLQNIFLVPH